MTALQKIIAEAKKIRKKYPKKEWKDCVAQASAIYAKKHKGKSPVGKKSKKVGAVKKKAAKKRAVSEYHKDTASHNVRINVLSGIKSEGMKLFKDKYGKLSTQKMLEKTKRGKAKIAKQMREVAAKIRKIQKL